MKNDFKIGDTIICKKDYVYKPSGKSNNNVSFLKNSKYKILTFSYWDNENKVLMYFIENWAFISTLEIHNLYLPKFEDYFYTNQEIRKMKLNKLQK